MGKREIAQRHPILFGIFCKINHLPCLNKNLNIKRCILVRTKIKDNGNGIQKHIIDNLYKNQHDKDKIGLANTHYRLKSIYPNNAGLCIKSNPSVETIISMSIPRLGV